MCLSKAQISNLLNSKNVTYCNLMWIIWNKLNLVRNSVYDWKYFCSFKRKKKHSLAKILDFRYLTRFVFTLRTNEREYIKFHWNLFLSWGLVFSNHQMFSTFLFHIALNWLITSLKASFFVQMNIYGAKSIHVCTVSLKFINGDNVNLILVAKSIISTIQQ